MILKKHQLYVIHTESGKNLVFKEFPVSGKSWPSIMLYQKKQLLTNKYPCSLWDCMVLQASSTGNRNWCIWRNKLNFQRSFAKDRVSRKYSFVQKINRYATWTLKWNFVDKKEQNCPLLGAMWARKTSIVENLFKNLKNRVSGEFPAVKIVRKFRAKAVRNHYTSFMQFLELRGTTWKYWSSRKRKVAGRLLRQICSPKTSWV